VLSSVVDHLPLVQQALPGSGRSVWPHVDHLQSPGAHRRLAPEVDRQEGPRVKPLTEGVPGSGEQQSGPGAGRGGEDHHDVAPGDVVEADLALDVLQMVDSIDCSGTTVGSHTDPGLVPDPVRYLHVSDHGG